MKIYKTKPLDQLPDVIARCSAPVFLVLEPNRAVELKPQTDIMEFFRRYCCGQNTSEIELRCSAPADARSITSYLMSA